MLRSAPGALARV